MEQTTPTPQPSTPQPTEQQPPPQPQPQPPTPPPTSSSSTSLSLPPPSSLPSTSSSTIPSSPNPNPNPNQKTPTPQPQQQQPSVQNSQTRPPFNRPWQQPSHFPHFSSHLPSVPPPHSSSASPSPPPVPPFSSSVSSSISAPPAQRGGGMAIGVPAHHPSPPPPTSFSSLNSPSFGQQFGGLGRNAVNVPESVTSSSTSQVRQPIQGIQGMGTIGSFGSGSQMRPGGIAAHHQQRPVQSSLRPQSTPNNQLPASQNFQGHGLLRASSMGSPGSQSPSASQSMQPHNQPWLSSGSQGKPPLPSPPFRPQMNPQSLQQRSHIPQQHHHPLSTASQQQQMPSAQQSQQPSPLPSPSHSPQEHYAQQFPSSRAPQSLSHQQQITRGPGLGNQKPSSHALVQPNAVQSGPLSRTTSAETGEYCNRILSKRSIQELVTQIDPSEMLDPEVEDILVDIADDFVESITTFGCSLAKHRKSSTLEAKDILLHLERNWNMTLPGFSGDEIKIFKKPFVSDIHKERLAVIKKSMVGADIANTKSSAGQAAGNAKGHLAKAPVNVMVSPDPKIREAA
uniref:Putative transcription initiation factor TFIID subunit 12 n=1 Tax=Davidia involucrata TaxID=16924 RepID=A0A5B6YVI7_DAVIN